MTVPNTAAAIRQPTDESAPNRAMPTPMRNFPSGGCTEKLPVARKVPVSPWAKSASAPFGQSAV